MKKVAIVAPVHIQPTPEWVHALQTHGNQADIIIVDDSDGNVKLPSSFDVYGYARQQEALGDELYALFEQFHHSAACKQFGLWIAYQMGYETIIVIDSDCNVSQNFIKDHETALRMRGDLWANPLTGTGWYSRGFPYSARMRHVVANMGLWTNELDLYGLDRVKNGPPPTRTDMFDRVPNVSPGAFFPLSGMNVAFKREVVPYMLFLPNFTNTKGEYFTRHDDIWGGYIFQKIMKAKGHALAMGRPFVYHDTSVDAEEDARAEVPMIANEDSFYGYVDAAFANEHFFQEASARGMFGFFAKMFENSPFNALCPAFQFQAESYPKWKGEK